jgi:hypothetical protein
MLEHFVVAMCLSTNYAACSTTTQAYYQFALQQPMAAYWRKNRVEAIEQLGLLIAASKERKLPIKLGENLLTLDAEQSIVSLRVPF